MTNDVSEARERMVRDWMRSAPDGVGKKFFYDAQFHAWVTTGTRLMMMDDKTVTSTDMDLDQRSEMVRLMMEAHDG